MEHRYNRLIPAPDAHRWPIRTFPGLSLILILNPIHNQPQGQQEKVPHQRPPQEILCPSRTCLQATACIPSKVLPSSRQKLKAYLQLETCLYANTPPTVGLTLLYARGNTFCRARPKVEAIPPCLAVGLYSLHLLPGSSRLCIPTRGAWDFSHSRALSAPWQI